MTAQSISRCPALIAASFAAAAVLIAATLFESVAESPIEGVAARTARLVTAMTRDEKIALVHSRFGMPLRGRPKPAGALDSAGYVPGISRLGIPPLQEADGGLGLANPTNADFDATAMPSGLALAATFDAGRATR